MKFQITRASVCAADDVDAPHSFTLSIPNPSTIEEIAIAIQKAGYLPSIAGGKATWSMVSEIPLAVIAQQWPKPKVVSVMDAPKDSIRLHVNYHAQMDPEIVFEVLRTLRFSTTHKKDD